MRAQTRQRILEQRAAIVHLKGFHHAGIQKIFRAAGVPKGPFHNYLKSKKDFVLQRVGTFVAHF